MAEGKGAKKVFVVIGAITAALAFIAGAAVLVLKFIEKKKSKEEYYIECDLSDEGQTQELDEVSNEEATLEE